jgi:hypothetical protein
MAGRVGEVASVTGGFGFTLNDDRGGTQCMTLVFETRDEAVAARACARANERQVDAAAITIHIERPCALRVDGVHDAHEQA